MGSGLPAKAKNQIIIAIEALTPVEAVFVSTAVIASIAMMIWFFAFAGSPLPN